MRMRSKLRRLILVGALAAFAAAPCLAATTAGEVYAGNAELIANTNCVVLADYCFGVGRAVSRNGGDGVGFSKARLLAQSKILDHVVNCADWPDDAPKPIRLKAEQILKFRISVYLAGIETVFERKEAPEHYLVVVAVSASALEKARPLQSEVTAAIEEAARKLTQPTDDLEATKDASDEIEEYAPRSYWEERGVKCNETLTESDFL